MIKDYALTSSQKLKQAKNLDDDDPVMVALHNILMIAPRVEGKKVELTVKDEIQTVEEEIANNEEGFLSQFDSIGFDDDEKPLTHTDFDKMFQTK